MSLLCFAGKSDKILCKEYVKLMGKERNSLNIKKVELPHFTMGKSYGSNQNWMMDPWMHLGGCAALTTCDAFIDFRCTGTETIFIILRTLRKK